MSQSKIQEGRPDYGGHLRSVIEMSRRVREAIINGSAYISEINRERDRYLAGLITVEQLEDRIWRHLKERDRG